MSDPNTNSSGASRVVLFVVLLVVAGLGYWLLAGGDEVAGDVEPPAVVEDAPADNG